MTTTNWLRGQTLYADELDLAFGNSVDRRGDNMVGDLVLFRDPTAPLGAVTKQYVDAIIATLPPGVYSFNGRAGSVTLTTGDVSAVGALMNTGGTVSAAIDWNYGVVAAPNDLSKHINLSGTFGISLTNLRMNIVAPVGSSTFMTAGDNTDIAQFSKGLIKVFTGIDFNSVYASSVTDLSHHINLYGGSWGMNVTSSGVNIVANGTAAIQFGAGTIQVSEPLVTTQPITLAADPTTNLQAATKQYVDNGVVGGAGANKGRNLFHNPLFNVQQRGVGNFTTSGAYTADRWSMALNTDTATVNLIAGSDTTRAAIGDEACSWTLHNTFAGSSAAAAFNFVAQRIEKIQRLSGKTITVSFWAQASTILNLGVGLAQFFGTGGSPSAQVNVPGQSISIGTAWQRYSVQITIPSSAGKTFGTNLDDFTQISFWFSSGSNNASQSGSVGVQSGQVFLWGMQCEIAGAMTALDKPDPAIDWECCKRFFQYHNTVIAYGYAGAGGLIISPFPFNNHMRATPTAVLDTITYLNASGAAVNTFPTYARLQCTATALGTAYSQFNLALSADL